MHGVVKKINHYQVINKLAKILKSKSVKNDIIFSVGNKYSTHNVTCGVNHCP